MSAWPFDRRQQYQLALRSGGPRIDLAGNEVGAVTADEANSAWQGLRHREVKAARRKAQVASAQAAAPAAAGVPAALAEAATPAASMTPAAAPAAAASRPRRLGLAEL